MLEQVVMATGRDVLLGHTYSSLLAEVDVAALLLNGVITVPLVSLLAISVTRLDVSGFIIDVVVVGTMLRSID